MRESIPDASTIPQLAYSNETTSELGDHPIHHSSATIPTDLPPNQHLLSPTIHTSPVLRAPSRNPSLSSIPELPPAAIQNPPFPIIESGPETSSVGRQVHYGNLGPAPISRSSWDVPSSGHSITLYVLPPPFVTCLLIVVAG